MELITVEMVLKVCREILSRSPGLRSEARGA